MSTKNIDSQSIEIIQNAYSQIDKATETYNGRLLAALKGVDGNERKAKVAEKKIQQIFSIVDEAVKAARIELNKNKMSTDELDKKMTEVTKLTEKVTELAKLAQQGKLAQLGTTPPATKNVATRVDVQTPTEEPKDTKKGIGKKEAEIPTTTKGLQTEKPPEVVKKDEPSTTKTPAENKKATKKIEAVKVEHVDKSAFDLIDHVAPVGIKNTTGSDCFVNSIMQLIIHVPELRDIVLDDDFVEVDDPIIEEVRTLLDGYYKKAVEGQDHSLTSVGVRAKLPQDLHMGQHDATEVLQGIFSHFTTDTLQSTFLNKRALDPVQKVEVNYPDPIQATNHRTVERTNALVIDVDVFRENPILVEAPNEQQPKDTGGWFSSFFGGAQTEASKPQPKYVIPETTLDRCFDHTLARGEVPSGEIYYHESTDKKTYKSSYIGGEKVVNDLNNHVFLRLKRYATNSGKITDSVEIPKTFRGSRQLKAFVQHQGASARGGHWVTYVKKQDSWYMLSDSSVTKVSESFALAQAKTSDLLYYGV